MPLGGGQSDHLERRVEVLVEGLRHLVESRVRGVRLQQQQTAAEGRVPGLVRLGRDDVVTLVEDVHALVATERTWHQAVVVHVADLVGVDADFAGLRLLDALLQLVRVDASLDVLRLGLLEQELQEQLAGGQVADRTGEPEEGDDAELVGGCLEVLRVGRRRLDDEAYVVELVAQLHGGVVRHETALGDADEHDGVILVSQLIQPGLDGRDRLVGLESPTIAAHDENVAVATPVVDHEKRGLGAIGKDARHVDEQHAAVRHVGGCHELETRGVPHEQASCDIEDDQQNHNQNDPAHKASPFQGIRKR